MADAPYASLTRPPTGATRATAPATAVAALLAVTLGGGVLAATAFPHLKPPITRAVAVAKLVAVPAPVVDSTSALAAIITPPGGWLAATDPKARLAAGSDATRIDGTVFGGEEIFYDAQGRQLTVLVRKTTDLPGDTDVKEEVNGKNADTLARTDDGIWSSHGSTDLITLWTAAGAKGALLVDVGIVGDPQSDPTEAIAITRAQLAALPASTGTTAAAPVSLRR